MDRFGAADTMVVARQHRTLTMVKRPRLPQHLNRSPAASDNASLLQHPAP
jgi:hypothetical protein